MPRTEAEWFGALRWQARRYLSRLRDRGDRHAKYIEEMSGLLDGVFADGHQGAGLDAGTRPRALARALSRACDLQGLLFTCSVEGRATPPRCRA